MTCRLCPTSILVLVQAVQEKYDIRKYFVVFVLAILLSSLIYTCTVNVYCISFMYIVSTKTVDCVMKPKLMKT